MADKPEEFPAATFKAQCLKLMDRVAQTRAPIIITKHGRPVAQLGPVPTGPRSLFGYMKGTLRTAGDVTSPVGVQWRALSGEGDVLYSEAPQTRRRKPTRK